MKISNRRKMTAEKQPIPVVLNAHLCHSERSEESQPVQGDEILPVGQNDKYTVIIRRNDEAIQK